MKVITKNKENNILKLLKEIRECSYVSRTNSKIRRELENHFLSKRNFAFIKRQLKHSEIISKR